MRRPSLVLVVACVVSLGLAFQSVPWSARRRKKELLFVVPLTYAAELATTAAALVAPGKGLLASDESEETLFARFGASGVECTQATVRAYRTLLYTTPELSKFITGVVLAAEAFLEETDEGVAFADVLSGNGAVPGVRIDTGSAVLPGAREGETFSRGLDGLNERASRFRDCGARFAKWRARFRISDRDGAPSALAIKENCWTMARSARTLQELGLVPLLEPAVLLEGDHAVERAAEIQERIYVEVFRALSENGVFLEGLILKPSMTTPGLASDERVTPELVAAYSVRTLERTVPSAVPGITFNSGGLSEEEASLCLDAMNRIERKGPWSVTFGFARSLQSSCLNAWAGNPDNTQAAQAYLVARAKANAAANLGQYAPGSQPTLDDTVGLRGWTSAAA
ncbi:hypothetical protein CTAYLR_001510 [Chrysophaeum taylorii]|uniref:Fructose-bisphosphate aldolase n=1 Tax=Chrysophaeum taylorii TaxID=2483200 RepID=A0AAD7UE75_9STRA|nr:hypothetical protein CTAYLR_001510 [Chrysophaeum taylorii]